MKYLLSILLFSISINCLSQSPVILENKDTLVFVTATKDTTVSKQQTVTTSHTYQITRTTTIIKKYKPILQPPVDTVMPAPKGNMALNKKVTVSSIQPGTTFTANLINDGDNGTRWSSAFSDPQFVVIDLGGNYQIDNIYILWETASAADYLIQTSLNEVNWRTAKTITGNAGLINNHVNLNDSGRYIRIYCTKRNTPFGISIYELEVYAYSPPADTIIPPIQPPPPSGIGYLGLPLYNSVGYVTLSNVSNQTIKGFRFYNPNGGINGGNDLKLVNCNNIIIEDNFFGSAYRSNVELENCSNITIRNNLFNDGSRGIYAVNCTGGIKTLNNQFINLSGKRINDAEYHRGQIVQYNNCDNSGNEIKGNRGINYFGESYNEDLISTYDCDATSTSPLTISGNIFVGGGPSSSSGGIIGGDGGGTNIIIENNKLVNPGQYGIAIAGGQFVTVRRNEVYADRFMWNGIGYYVANFSPGTCGNSYIDATNKSNYTKSDGSKNEYWNGGSCNPCNCNWPTTGQSLASMNIPNPLITFINEDDIWKLRSVKYFYNDLLASGNRAGGNGAPPSIIDLSRPEANAGEDQTISGTTVTLTSKSTPSAGNVLIAWLWIWVAGPSKPVNPSPTSATTTFTGLAKGTHTFRLEVTQNNGDGYNYKTYDADWVTVMII